jgi:hypothetical protein
MINLLNTNEIVDVNGGGVCICFMMEKPTLCFGLIGPPGSCFPNFFSCCMSDIPRTTQEYQVPGAEMCALKCREFKNFGGKQAYSVAYSFDGVRYDI